MMGFARRRVFRWEITICLDGKWRVGNAHPRWDIPEVSTYNNSCVMQYILSGRNVTATGEFYVLMAICKDKQRNIYFFSQKCTNIVCERVRVYLMDYQCLFKGLGSGLRQKSKDNESENTLTLLRKCQPYMKYIVYIQTRKRIQSSTSWRRCDDDNDDGDVDDDEYENSNRNVY